MTTTQSLEQTALMFHALSDPTRLQVVQLLRHGERCVCDLTAALDAAQSRLSFHLKVLKDAGILNDRREGRWVYYELRPEALAAMAEQLETFEPHTARRGCCS